MRKPAEKKHGQKQPAVAAEPMAAEATPVEAAPVTIEVLRAEIDKVVRAAAVTMVKETITLAKQGQYQAMKYLFEMIGLFPPTALPERAGEDSLAGMLLNRLGILDKAAREGKQPNPVE